MARRLSRQIASPVDPDDLVQEAMLWAHKSFPQILRARSPHTLARTVMSRAMWRLYYSGNVRKARKQDPLEAATHVPDVSADTGVGQIFFTDFFTALEREHGTEARRVAEALVQPNTTCAWTAIAETVHKRQAGAGRGTGEHHVGLPARIIQEQLGYNGTRWYKMMCTIRQFTRRWLATSK